jgi:hypothetical protein
MRFPLVCSLLAALLMSVLPDAASARKITREPLRYVTSPQPDIVLPSEATAAGRAAAAVDTLLLHWASFDGPAAQPDPMGYVTLDITEQVLTAFHVADTTELYGGDGGFMLPLSGDRSMWCGQSPSTNVPFCAYATSSGVYFYRMVTKDFVKTRKMVLLK